jgi:hypothetical protein
MRMPNFLRYPTFGAEDATFNVGQLSPEDAANLWDEWKSVWLAHVEKRATATVPAATPPAEVK